MIILRELKDIGREMGVEELSRSTGLSKRQVHNALTDLKRRKLIDKRVEFGKAGYKVPPKGKIYVQIREGSLKRIRKLIKNGRRN